MLLLLVVACEAPAARADRVVPSAGVTNPVPVRSAPSSDSEKVGENADGYPGGCSNIRLAIGLGSTVVGSVWVGDEQVN